MVAIRPSSLMAVAVRRQEKVHIDRPAVAVFIWTILVHGCPISG